MRDIKELQMLQALPLAVKVQKTKQRIREWVDYFGLDGVYVSFSGGLGVVPIYDEYGDPYRANGWRDFG